MIVYPKREFILERRSLPATVAPAILNWLRENCPGRFQVMVGHVWRDVAIRFDDEADLMLFQLRWNAIDDR